MALKTQILFLNVVWSMSVRAGSMSKREPLTLQQLPASDAQIQDLAQNVCRELQNYMESETAVNNCVEGFKVSDRSLPVSASGFRLRCHSEYTISFNVNTSKYRHLVVVVPDPLDRTALLSYRIIEPGAKLHDLETTPDELTIFTSILSNRGRHSHWLEEAKIHRWVEPPHKEYDIEVQFTKINSTDAKFDGVITWNRTGETDACFYFISWCEKSGVKEMSIQPDTQPRVEFKNLHENDICNVNVVGRYGKTTTRFFTPTSDIHNVIDDVKKTSPAEVSANAQEVESGWTVRVNWSEPGITPDVINVTLFADKTDSLVVPGNATEVTFKNVTGSGIYTVAISSILGGYASHTSRRALFYNESSRKQWRWASAVGGAWGAWGAVSAAAAAALAWLRLKRRKHPPRKLIPPVIEIKPVEETLMESVGDSTSLDGWDVKSERVLLHEVVGEGAFGVVRRGTLAPNGKEVAVKMLKEFPSLEEMRSFHLEMELMKSVGAHPHIVSLLGCCGGKRPLIIAEYCSRGDLLSFLRHSWNLLISKHAKYYNNNIETSGNYRIDLILKCKMPQESSQLAVNRLYDLPGSADIELTALDLLSFCRQIAIGMEFLAANRLVHRDLAARNVLVTSDKTLKIADFGLSRDVYEENQYKQKGNGKMPVKWMALESLTRRIYTSQSDVWSFGVVVWEIVTVGASPYPEVPAARLPRLLRAGYRMPRPPNCSKHLYDLMISCWRARPHERPTFAELHRTLDELLNSACADTYLSLELDDDAPPAPIHQRYLKMIIRAKRHWTRSESYERPLLAPRSNIYSTPPVANKTTV